MGFFKNVDILFENQRLKRELKLKEDELKDKEDELKGLRQRHFNYKRCLAACENCVHGLLGRNDDYESIGCEIYQKNNCNNFKRKE